jgi:TRAP-type C4-dicarboxylate transport system substrate-binding protein
MACIAAVALLGARAAADPVVTIRLATVAPDGTAWAQLAREFSREVEAATNGQVRFHWLFGGVAGDELDMLDRIQRGEFDGEVGANFCDRLASSLRVAKLLGLFESRDEELAVLQRLTPYVDLQFKARGFVNLGLGMGFGDRILFTRHPVRTLADLRRERLWIWDLDEVERLALDEMRIPVAPTAIYQASRAYEDRHADGFLTIPTAALAFRWSAQVQYYTDLHVDFLPGCIAVSQGTFDRLSEANQAVVRAAAARLIARFNEAGRITDGQLLNGAFEKQGLKRLPASDAFRAEFVAAARAAREKLGPRLTTPALLEAVDGWLAALRARAKTP